MTAEVLIQRESVTLESIEFSTPHGDTCKKLRRLLQLDTDVELDALELILSTLSARASNTGSWYWTYGSKIIWSNANHMLFEKTREEFKGEFDEFLSFVLPQDRVIINDWVEVIESLATTITASYNFDFDLIKSKSIKKKSRGNISIQISVGGKISHTIISGDIL
eukprot:TRINITY_DN4438_c0_g1_i1.p1 TRINITY_DN4438_c0_g1~~TRINITY_DN4438_c0_g1_i1.p1  ORF type:complete len:165 (+),score=20.51 TRINITY_DN4438_c0_g1_i1:245-739(+)